MTDSHQQDAAGTVVIGAGPAGLTAAYALAQRGLPVTILEASSVCGGISRTVAVEGCHYDLGGHRFFSKNGDIEALWDELASEPLLERARLSRIYYDGKFYDYPLRIGNALRNMGPVEAGRVLGSFAAARVRPTKDVDTFEGWVTSRFGRRLYEMFFASYTEKVWGRPCSEISAEWAAQRIRNLSLSKALVNAVVGNRGDRATSLIDRFRYPRLGPGQLWDSAAIKCASEGATLLRDRRVVGFETDGDPPVIHAVLSDGPHGHERHAAAAVLSSMPLRDLVAALPEPPEPIRDMAAALGYRGFFVVALVLDTPDLFPDNWVYAHSSSVRVARVQNFGNWSPDMLPGPGVSCLGAEYFADPQDELWNTADDQLIDLAESELRRIGLLSRGRVIFGHVTRVPDAYPVYERGHSQWFAGLQSYLTRLPNLWCIGRAGQHRYNNMDHSMMSALLAAANVADGGRRDVWAVNTEAEYHEESAGREDAG